MQSIINPPLSYEQRIYNNILIKLEYDLLKLTNNGIQVFNIGIATKQNGLVIESELFIREDQFYKWCFLDGVTDKAIFEAANHAKIKLSKIIDRLH